MLNLDYAQFVSQFLLPPTILILIALLGLMLRISFPRTGNGFLFVSFGLFTLLSLPIITLQLMSPLQDYVPLTTEQIQNPEADVIVVLAAGRSTGYKEYGGDSVPPLGLERIRYAAWLKRRTNLPMLVSGGKQKDQIKSEAELMQEVLQKEFLIEVDFVEERARNTFENALYTASILRDRSSKKIYLVSHAWHLARAVEAFRKQAIEVIPAPTAYYGNKDGNLYLSDLLPSSKAFYYSTLAIHEYFGILWYRIRYY